MNPVICGSMGEAHHLTPEERVTLIKAARKGLDAAGLQDATIIAGTYVLVKETDGHEYSLMRVLTLDAQRFWINSRNYQAHQASC